jgi:hypothetical protein
MANVILAFEATAEKIGAIVATLAAMGARIVPMPNGGAVDAADVDDDDSAHEADVDRRVAAANAGRQQRPNGNGGTRRGNTRTVYVVQGSKRAQETALNNMAGARAQVFRVIMANSGKLGMADLQRKLASKMPAKTVDGSLYALRQSGVIKSAAAPRK